VPDLERAANASDATWQDDGITQGRMRRTAPLVRLATRTAGEAVAVGLRAKLTGADTSEFHTRTAERYAELLGHSKGALMKAGQLLSLTSAGAAVPAEAQPVYRTALARLRNDAPPMAGGLARAVLERELGCSAQSAFAEFDWKPLAAASIGQVHAARLHDGRAVAVKIQYPGVADAIGADLKNTELIATFLSLMTRGLSPWRMSWDVRGYSHELRAHITEELDYSLEAANQAEFARRYRGHPFIHIPDVIPELCTDRVLTQELVRGEPWHEALGASQALRDRWAEVIHRFFWGSYHRFRMFNADPHPGNFLFHSDGSVSFLDFGCVKHIQPERAEMIDAILRACISGDALATWCAAVEAGFWRSSDPITPEEALAWWGKDSPMLAPQPSPPYNDRSLSRYVMRKFSPNGPCGNLLRHATPPPDCSIMTRVELGVYTAVAHLRAHVDWRPVTAEHYWNAAPCTEMGRSEHAFFAERS